MSRLGVITNPTSGSGRGARLGAETLAALVANGHQVRNLSHGSWVASYEAAMKHRRSLDALVVVGGDGMVHLGIQVCAERKLPLGIVAAGSGNDLAKTLDLPEYELAHAIARIEDGLRGDVTAIDVGKISGPTMELPGKPRYFSAVLSAGIDAAVAAYGSNLKYPRGPLKYKVATARELPRFKPYGVRLTVDGKSWEQQCTLVAVANSPVFGGGLRVSPDSSVLDGVLELVIAEPMKRTDIMRLFPKLMEGTHFEDPRCRLIRAKNIVIGQGRDGAQLPPAFADGELVGAEPLTVGVVKAGLRVLGARAK